MFERFTAPAREVVVRSHGHAREMGHGYIGTEHLLLALLDESSGTAYRVLHGAGLDGVRARADVERLVGRTGTILSEQDAAALRTIGIDLDAVLARIEESFGPGALAPAAPRSGRGPFRRRHRDTNRGHPRFSGRAKKVLELALREAVHLRHNHIGSEHILLGLLREGHGIGAKVLAGNGLDLDDLRARTIASLDRAA